MYIFKKKRLFHTQAFPCRPWKRQLRLHVTDTQEYSSSWKQLAAAVMLHWKTALALHNKSLWKKNHSRKTTHSSQMKQGEGEGGLQHNPTVSSDVWLPGSFYLKLTNPKLWRVVGGSVGPQGHSSGSKRGWEGMGGGHYCHWGVTQRNVPAPGSCTATLFPHQSNPHVCTQGMGTPSGQALSGNSTVDRTDDKRCTTGAQRSIHFVSYRTVQARCEGRV